MRRTLGYLGVAGLLVLSWQMLIWLTGLPAYLLPAPQEVLAALSTHRVVLTQGALTTWAEMLGGFAIGVALGALLAVGMSIAPRLTLFMRPVLLLSQTIPIFALAPILTLWLGYGMAPKVVITALICLFPVASAFLAGLDRSALYSRDLARTLQADYWREICLMRVPMALPMLGAGIKLAAVYAPVGAVIGEWAGGSEGLGAVMIHANGRMRIDLVFAALSLVTATALIFHAAVSRLADRAFARYQ